MEPYSLPGQPAPVSDHPYRKKVGFVFRQAFSHLIHAMQSGALLAVLPLYFMGSRMFLSASPAGQNYSLLIILTLKMKPVV